MNQHPVQVVIFGASGDLTARKLIPALVDNARRGAFGVPVQVIGVARRPKTAQQWRDELFEWLSPKQRAVWAAFSPNVYYLQCDVSKAAAYRELADDLDELAAEFAGTCGRLFYLALAPRLFAGTVQGLSKSGMLESDPLRDESWRRIVIEKPFGTDLGTAQWLNLVLRKHLREDQIYRIDHYLGKETVQNLLAFRFTNAIWEPLWSRDHVESVEISVCETVSVADRGGYYDQAGALRDMVQNHVMQLLALVTMEAPTSMDPEAVRGEKVKVIDALVPFETPTDVWRDVVRGQYTAAPKDTEKTTDPGYLQAPGVPPDSRTETYIAIRAQIHNWRWNGVPFLLRTGKSLHARYSEVVVRFKAPPADLFNGPPGAAAAQMCRLRPNELVLRIQPDEGVRLRFLVKQPGPGAVMRQATLGFDYKDIFDDASPQAYERLLLDAIAGNPTLFIRGDEAEASWRFCDSIRAGWDAPGAPPPCTYPTGSSGPSESDDLFRGCEGVWGDGR
jgi:glucose-6-phosphate 1-dehydrogenase